MDWHPVISVQQQTHDNDFCHFSISNVRFAFWVFFSKTGKTRVSRRVEMMTRWPGRERWPKWPIDPVPQWPSSMSRREMPFLVASDISLNSYRTRRQAARGMPPSARQYARIILTAVFTRRVSTNWFEPSDNSRKHICSAWVPTAHWRHALKGSLGKKRAWRQCTWSRTGPEAEPEAEYSTAPRRGSLARTRRGAPFLGNGLSDRAAILGVFKPVRLECQILRSLMLAWTVVWNLVWELNGLRWTCRLSFITR